MPVPSSITDLSTTAGSNSPAGTDPIGTDADNFIRAHAAFIAQLRDGSKNLELATATAPALAFTGDSNTGIYSPAADTVGVSVGGTMKVKVSDTVALTVGSGASGVYSGSSTLAVFNATVSYVEVSNGTKSIMIGADSGIPFIGTFSDHDLVLRTNNTAKWTIDSTGRLLNTDNAQPSFRGTSSSSETGSTATFDTYTETYDQGGNFNHTTGAFVAPVAGVYLFVLDWQCSLSSSGQVEVQIYNSTTATSLAYGEFSLGSAAGIIKQGAVVALARLAASDSVIARTGTVTNGTGYANVFSGHLLG